jgi:hypothetical protein
LFEEIRKYKTAGEGKAVTALCAMMGLNRAGFYRWRWPRPGIPVEMELRSEIQKIVLESRSYGYRRITAELQRRNFDVNQKRVLRMLREDNLLCVRRRAFVTTTDSRHSLPVYPNLAREAATDSGESVMGGRYYLHPIARGVCVLVGVAGCLLTSRYRMGTPLCAWRC